MLLIILHSIAVLKLHLDAVIMIYIIFIIRIFFLQICTDEIVTEVIFTLQF